MSSSTLAGQITAIREQMMERPPGLFRHAKRVVAEALDLAERWDVDPQRVELASWGHDLFRATKPPELLTMAWEMKIPVSEAEEDSPMLLHGPVAACVLEERFHVSDDDVLSAIRDHTLGAPDMPLLAKIVLLADKFEPNKRERTPVMKLLRQAARRDIDLALTCWSDWRWVANRTSDIASPPVFWEARANWVPAHHLELLRTAPALVEDDGWYEASDAFEPPPDRRTLEERRAARRARDEKAAQTVR